MALPEHTPESLLLEEAITVLFCEIDDTPTRPSTQTGTATRIPQAALGLGGHHPHALSTTARDRVRTLLLARGYPLFLASLPGGGGPSSFLVAPEGTQAQALL